MVHADDARARPDDEVVRELALPGADVEHALAGSHPLDEEVVVAREAMLRVHAALVGDRREVELAVHVVVGDEQLPWRHVACPGQREGPRARAARAAARARAA